jgi:hypothetical protein
MFESLIRPQGRNSLAADSHASSDNSPHEYLDDDYYSAFGGTPVPITPELRDLIHQHLSPGLSIPKEAKSVTHIHHRQIAYSIRKRHEGNSGVLFHGNETPFSIDRILQFPTDVSEQALQGTWVIGHYHQHAQISHDPYLAYPHLGMCMWDYELESNLEAVPVEQIRSHFAKCVIPWEGKMVAVITSLSRVC